jgi:hypothetical protein
MPTPEIVDKVRDLRKQIAESKGPEAEALRKQIDTILLEPEHRPHYRSLVERLRALYRHIVASSPNAAALIEEVANELTAAGL